MTASGQSNYGGFIMTTTTQIVSRNKAKGTDFCGLGNYLYVIRSDLGCYMKAHRDPDSKHPVKIHPLHPNCAWGDHYLATKAPDPDENHFYIIRGDDCHIVTDLSTGTAPTTVSPPKFKLHKQCRGGDFYLAMDSNNFYVIKSSSKKYLHLNSLTDNTLPNPEFNLSVDCRKCQYYWASRGHFHILKPTGLEYYRSKDLGTSSTSAEGTIYSPVTTFLRGGLSMTTPNKIVPHNQTKGTDICGQGNYLYIIRSDLGIFVKARHELDGNDPVTIHPLHPKCGWGDHYLATMARNPDKNHFYIIRGDDCHIVTDLSTGAAPTTVSPQKFKLHKQCRGGDFYLAKNSNSFYVIKSSNNKYLHLNSLTHNILPNSEFNLSVDCRECQYYWATENHFFFLKYNPTSLECHRSKDLNINSEGATSAALYSSVATFLPVMGNTTQIVPRTKAKGTDFCGQESYQYIIRSDLGCYMKAYHVRDGDDPVTIHPLHLTCAWGDHYLATPDYFYIIKGDECRRVKDLRTGANPEIFPLHDKCKPNSGAYPSNCFYTATDSDNFYIIRSDNSFLHVEDMSETGYKEKLGGKLHDECKGGVYYWATKGYFYFVKQVNNWSLGYHRTRFLFRKGSDYPVYAPITKFLPGGLAVIMGPTFAKWELIKTIDNKDETTPLKFSEDIIRKNGYKKEVVESIQHNWNISTHEVTTTLTTEKIVTAAFKQAFLLPREYGGCKFDSTEEDWTAEQRVNHEFVVNVPKRKCVYIWQLKLGIGKAEWRQDVFYTCRVKPTVGYYTDTPTPPPIETPNEPEGSTDTPSTDTVHRPRSASLPLY